MNRRLELTYLGLVALCVFLAGPVAAQTPPIKQLGEACTNDGECQDASYCNGVEVCRGTCMAAPQPCVAGQQCDDAGKRCITLRTDADGDGHNSLATGGDDCDDLDVNNFPGHYETWDAADHDDDCNLRTHGLPPGFGGVGRVGPVQVCSGGSVVVLDGVVGGEESFREVKCDVGYACRAQPSGEGACQPAGADYVAPPVLANIPHADQVLPSHDPVQRGLANPAPMRPLLPKVTAMPAAKPKAVAVPVIRPKLACPAGQAFSAATGTCIPIPPL